MSMFESFDNMFGGSKKEKGDTDQKENEVEKYNKIGTEMADDFNLDIQKLKMEREMSKDLLARINNYVQNNLGREDEHMPLPDFVDMIEDQDEDLHLEVIKWVGDHDKEFDNVGTLGDFMTHLSKKFEESEELLNPGEEKKES